MNQEQIAYQLMQSTYPDLKPPLAHFAAFKPWRAEKNEILIRQGEPTLMVRFLISGLARLVYVNEEGFEQTKYFLGPGFFLIPIHSVFLGKKSWFTIQASIPCRGLAMEAKVFKHLLGTDLQWANYWNAYLTRLFIDKENRERDLLTLGAEDKYLDLLANFPMIANQVPLYQVASYLGITGVTLSRIRKKLKS